MMLQRLYKTSLALALFMCLAFSSTATPQSLLIRVDAFFGGPVHKTNEPYTLAGEVIYMGDGVFESVYLNWQLEDDDEVQTTFFDDLSLNPYIPFRYEVSEKWIPTQAGVYEFTFWFSGLNGDESNVPASEEFQVTIEVYDQLPQKQVVLLESFSSVNCGSCALVTPILRNLVAQNPQQYAQIYYHPLHYENSPLYHFNPKDQDNRRDLYDVFYTPFSVIGSLFSGGSELVDEQLLQYELNKWAGFSLSGEWFVQDNTLYYDIEGEIFMETANPQKDLRLLVVGVEDSVAFDSPPGSNGEDTFYNVMRFFAPDAQGTRITPDAFDGSIAMQKSMPWIEQLDTAKMTLMLFVQDFQSKEIYQAVFMDHNIFMDPDDPTSIVDPHTPEINVFPNPASDFITIAFRDNHLPQVGIIYDLQGRQVLREYLYEGHTGTLDVSGLTPGVYILHLTSREKRITKRISIIAQP
ncbi:MAG: T9SS type A sorting domain-containing protein [Bacteroidota bacterium]